MLKARRDLGERVRIRLVRFEAHCPRPYPHPLFELGLVDVPQLLLLDVILVEVLMELA